MSDSDKGESLTGPELFDAVFARLISQGGNTCIYEDLSLSKVEEVEKYYLSLDKPGSSMRHAIHFEEWFYAHCIGRQIRPVEALEAFRLSNSCSVRAIAIKALKDRYGVSENDRLAKSMADSTRQTMWAMWVSAAATVVTALIAFLQFNNVF